MRSTGILAMALALGLTVACGNGRDQANNTIDETVPGDTTVGTGGELGSTAADARDVRNWVQDVVRHNTAEIELGKLASEKAANARVRQYGEMMVKDHTMAGNELKQAVAGQIPVQEEIDDEHRELMTKLQGLQGAEFDREYIDAMVDGHQEVARLLEDRAEDANRGTTTGTTGTTGAADNLEMAVNQWAAKTLPKVQEHLQQAEQLRDQLRDTRNTTN